MAENKSPLPATQIVVLLGHGEDAGSRVVDERARGAERTFQALYLPRGNGICDKWPSVERLFVVRKSQKDAYNDETMDTNGFHQVVMPDRFSRTASDRREWIRTNLGFARAAIRIQSDADFRYIGENSSLASPWLGPDDARPISILLGAWVLKFQHEGLDFAGFGDHTNQPSTTPGIYMGRPPMSFGYFKETLTFERNACPGRYPEGWDFKEGAWRILDTVRQGGKAARFFPIAQYATRSSSVYEHPDADAKVVLALRKEFGDRVVLKRPPVGLNLQSYGRRRNRLRKT